MYCQIVSDFFNRDYPTASPEVYAILCLCKEWLCQESTLRGFRREVRFIMSPPGKRRHNELNAAPPPETPGERARRERQVTEVECRAEKVSAFGAKTVRQLSARHDSVALTRFFPQRKMRTVGFCFGDRDFMTASPEVYAILCSCKERLCQESTLRGFRREVRFIMSPPGKRRHNELNAAPPPETPRGTGKTGEASD